MTGMATMDVRPLPEAPFGAQVTGFDPSRLTDTDRDQILEAHRQGRGLVCFRFGRLLEADELHALTSVFGANEFAPGLITGYGRGRVDGEAELTIDEQVERLRARGVDPFLTHLGNADPVTLEARPTDDTFYGEWEWHTDMSYIEVPPTFSLLHGRRLPAEGGDTWFASQVLALEGLPPDLRAQVGELQLKHDSTYTSSGLLRPGMSVPTTPVEAQGAIHPVVRRVPSTGQEALFLGRRTNGYLVGLDLDESERLLDRLWAEATRPEYCYRHRWAVGDTVVWDNRLLLHKRDPVPADEVRFMWRTQTKGEAVLAS